MSIIPYITAGLGLISLIGAIVGFFVMQTKQNMKIENLEIKHAEVCETFNNRFEKIEKKVSNSSYNLTEMEKTIVEIKTILTTTLLHISDDISELKSRRKDDITNPQGRDK